MFCKQKMFLEISQNSQENTCVSVSLKKECEFCEISKNTFFLFYRTPLGDCFCRFRIIFRESRN